MKEAKDNLKTLISAIIKEQVHSLASGYSLFKAVDLDTKEIHGVIAAVNLDQAGMTWRKTRPDVPTYRIRLVQVSRDEAQEDIAALNKKKAKLETVISNYMDLMSKVR